MKPLTIAELQHLMADHTAPCVSLFMPTHRDHRAAAQDPIRFKNLLGEAEKLLRDSYGSRDATELLAPLQEMQAPSFWRDQQDGLAVFRSRDVLEQYRIPMPLPERAVVSPSFHIRPLIRFLQSNRLFYVLALSQKHVTLHHGTADSIAKVGVRDIPVSMEEIVGKDHRGGFANQHGGGAGGGKTHHGSGTHDAGKKDELLRFFRTVDARIWELLRDSHAPLVLAGVGYYHPIYRSVSRYRYLLEEGVEGNFERASAAELHERTWPIASRRFGDQEQAALDEYARLRGNGLCQDDLANVARAAIHGRVRLLMLARGTHRWGVMDRTTGEISERGAQTDAQDDDVLDDLAEAVLARGGEVLVLEPERMPAGNPVAAILRW